MVKGYKVKLLIHDNDEKTDEEILQNNPCLENNLLVNNEYKRLKGYCHNYALKDNSINIHEAFDYIVMNYKQIPIYKAKKGDIMMFYDNYKGQGLPKHFATIYKTNNILKGTTIRSKWGRLGIYETDLYHLPEEYGCYMEVWTKKGV